MPAFLAPASATVLAAPGGRGLVDLDVLTETETSDTRGLEDTEQVAAGTDNIWGLGKDDTGRAEFVAAAPSSKSIALFMASGLNAVTQLCANKSCDLGGTRASVTLGPSA